MLLWRGFSGLASTKINSQRRKVPSPLSGGLGVGASREPWHRFVLPLHEWQCRFWRERRRWMANHCGETAIDLGTADGQRQNHFRWPTPQDGRGDSVRGIRHRRGSHRNLSRSVDGKSPYHSLRAEVFFFIISLWLWLFSFEARTSEVTGEFDQASLLKSWAVTMWLILALQVHLSTRQTI